jgi:hypothetical protein
MAEVNPHFMTIIPAKTLPAIYLIQDASFTFSPNASSSQINAKAPSNVGAKRNSFALVLLEFFHCLKLDKNLLRSLDPAGTSDEAKRLRDDPCSIASAETSARLSTTHHAALTLTSKLVKRGLERPFIDFVACALANGLKCLLGRVVRIGLPVLPDTL